MLLDFLILGLYAMVVETAGRARLLPSRNRQNTWPYTPFFADSRLGRSLALPLSPRA